VPGPFTAPLLRDPADRGGGSGGGAGAAPRAHFRAHERRRVRMSVTIVAQRSPLVVDLSLAGAGIETEEPLVPGERISIAFATPTMWDPLVLFCVVAWAHPPRPTDELDALGRPRTLARAGVVFEYPTPDAVLAMFEMLGALEYE
jgi:hypothetical protein